MSRYIALLRAINVGGHTVKMEQLRKLFEALGFAEVETFIASGNVIFASDSSDPKALQRKIEAHLRQALGYEVATFLRTESEIAAIAQYQPFNETELKSAVALNVAFLAEPLTAEAQQALLTLKTAIDDFHVQGREVYWLCRVRQSESKFSNALFEKRLGVKATFRGFQAGHKISADKELSTARQKAEKQNGQSQDCPSTPDVRTLFKND
jgi:uncharacterized protein (DUF1697 family)